MVAMTVTVPEVPTSAVSFTSQADLAMALPSSVAERAGRFLLAFPNSAAALSLLVRVSDPAWHAAVGECEIDAGRLLAWAWGLPALSRNRLLVEAAVSFFVNPQVHVPVRDIVLGLDDDYDFAAVQDALRIAREGLS